MRSNRRIFAGTVLGMMMTVTFSGCDKFLTVTDPNVVNAASLNPVQDASTLSLSARQLFFAAAGLNDIYSAYFINEAWPAETNNNYWDLWRRDAQTINLLLPQVWGGLSTALVTGDQVIGVLKGTANENSSVDLARAALVSGYSAELLAETFCQVAINGGPPLTTTQALDSAIARFSRAVTVAGASTDPEAASIKNAALVGRARAELQHGLTAQAATDAGQVAAGFEYDLLFSDSPADRAKFPDRINNPIVANSLGRRSIVVPPEWRVTDPRVPWLPPSPPTQNAVDGVTPYYSQAKYTSYAQPIRLASKLEADYIVAEVQGGATELNLINSRRAANGQPAYSGDMSPDGLLTELMEQKGREFWLEGHRMGDWRRNGAHVLHVPPTGTPFFSPNASPVGNQTCLPVPIDESSNNPNFPKS